MTDTDRDELINDLLARAKARFVGWVVGTLASSILALAGVLAGLWNAHGDLDTLKSRDREQAVELHRLRAEVDVLKAERLNRRVSVARDLYAYPWR